MKMSSSPLKLKRNGDPLLQHPCDYRPERVYQFVLDTGATVSVFDITLKGRLRPTGAYPGRRRRPTRRDLRMCSDASLGKFNLIAGPRGICADLSAYRKACNKSAFGVLGMDFLRDKILHIDFDAGRLSFLRRAGKKPGQHVPIHWSDFSLPMVELDLAGIGPAEFLLDTGRSGFASGFLSADTFKRLDRAGGMVVLPERQNVVNVIGGARKVRLGEVSWQSLGGSRHEKQIYAEDDSAESCNGLALGYLGRYKATFDFVDDMVILQPGKWFARNCPANWAGIDIATDKGGPVIVEVDECAHGWRAGLRPGDRIVRVNGADADQLTMHQLGSMLGFNTGDCAVRELSLTWGPDLELLKFDLPCPPPLLETIRPRDKLRREVRLARPQENAGLIAE